MLRVRFHGRGGHGVKTASRILGTAAFMEGLQVQDFPVYGAERRGAAIAAFTRIDRDPILERGIITHPDYVIIADETLLRDPSASVLSGCENASALFVNSPRSPLSLREEIGGSASVQAFDLTSLMREVGQSSNYSAALGAIASRLTGVVSEKMLSLAMREELASLSLGENAVKQNVTVALSVFTKVEPIALSTHVAPMVAVGIHLPRFEPGPMGVPIIHAAGNSAARKTGSWRIVRPVIDTGACTRCLLCLAHCPEGVVSLDQNGYPQVDYDHCKGCMICARECPLHCIREVTEVRAW